MVVLLAFVLLLGFSTLSQAKIYMATLDVFTNKVSDPTKSGVDFVVKVLDDAGLRGPAAISSITVAAPGGQSFDITNGTWDEWQGQFHARFNASAFDGGVIPKGTYTATVTDTSPAVTLTCTDALSPATFMNLPVLNSIPVSLTPAISWGAVAGAKLYQVQLENVDKQEPVYFPPNQIFVLKPTFTIPAGVLVPNTNYRVRIDAMDNDKNPNRRSRSDWIPFTTPAGP
jgi:hypothetical protein